MYLEYLPPVLRNYKEIKLIAEMVEPEINLLKKEMQQQLDNMFILSADRKSLRRYEKMLNIVSKETDSLQDRRKRILLKYNSQPPYTIRTLKKKLNTICGENGYNLSVDTVKEELYLNLREHAWNNIKDAEAMLEEMTPLNLILFMVLSCIIQCNLTIDSRFIVKSELYPRYNIANLKLDGTWKIDGCYHVNGYKSGDYVDFYPVKFANKNPLKVRYFIDSICSTTGSLSVQIKTASLGRAMNTVQASINHNTDVFISSQMYCCPNIRAYDTSNNHKTKIVASIANESVFGTSKEIVQIIDTKEHTIFRTSAFMSVRITSTLTEEHNIWRFDEGFTFECGKAMDGEVKQYTL